MPEYEIGARFNGGDDDCASPRDGI
jgi:hypothetical protein